MRRYGAMVAIAAFLSASSAWALSGVPSTNDFNSATPGDDVTNYNGWTTTANDAPVSGAGVIQNSFVKTGNAVSLSNNSAVSSVLLSQVFAAPNATNIVWVDFYAKPILGSSASFATNSSAVFYFLTNSNIVAYDWTTAVQTATAVSTQDWNRFQVKMNYQTKKWDLMVNGAQAFVNYGFFDTNQTVFTNFTMMEGNPYPPSFLDDLAVTLNVTPGAMDVTGAVSVTASSASVGGALTLASEPSLVQVYYGPTDGGAIKGAWASNVLVGASVTPPATFAQTVSALPDTVYYYRIYASNTTDGEVFAPTTFVWTAQTRSSGTWYYVTIPAELSGNDLLLTNRAGQMLAEGMVPAGGPFDSMYLQRGGTSNLYRNVLRADGWHAGPAGPLSTEAFAMGDGVGLKRYLAGSKAYAALTGPKASSSVTYLFPSNSWKLFGWPFEARPLANLAVPGAKAGSGSASADQMMVDGKMVYLNTNGSWYLVGESPPAKSPTALQLRPANAYWYVRQSTQTSFYWTASPTP